MSLLHLDRLTSHRGGKCVVDQVSLSINAGECVGLIGPNGAGKTSLMRAALGLLSHTGVSSLASLSATARAKSCSWMPQDRVIAWPVSVEMLVALGRLPHIPQGSRLAQQDRDAVEAALVKMDLQDMRNRSATELSGGEQARVLIARTLAQQTPLLMADEPTAGLDPAGQIATMQIFSDLAASGHSVLVSLHDLGLAARHCTRLVLVDGGCLIADGSPEQVLNEQNLRSVFGISAYFEQTKNGAVFQPLKIL
ncbi:MAG: ABC transporter ATP-binding protein [Roseobacter sp.]